MSQEFQILRCCDCEKFQVHHVKKAKKWQCKVCGLKQSLKKAFFIGSSCDCRVIVQKLNFQAGEQEIRRRLGESCSSTDVYDENHSLELDNKEFDFPTGNVCTDESDWVDEKDWIDENDGIDGNDWADENDWIDEDDGFDDIPSDILGSLQNRNSQTYFDDELPRKKQRRELYPEIETTEEDSKFIQLIKDVENQEVLFSSVSKCKKDGTSSKSVESPNNIPSNQVVAKKGKKQESDSVKDSEEDLLSESGTSKLNSLLKPTKGFQLILNEAKKQRSNLNYDLDL